MEIIANIFLIVVLIIGIFPPMFNIGNITEENLYK